MNSSLTILVRFFFPAVFLAAFAWTQPLAIQHVTVIDSTGQLAQPEMTVVIERDRIAAVTSSKQAKVPANAQIIDGTGKFLIPGLWDMHVHGATDAQSAWSYRLYIANGVVGVREMWGPEDANAWRAQHAIDPLPSPTVYVGSPILDGPQPVWPGSIAIEDEAQARRAVDRYKGRGAEFIKVYNLLPRDAYFGIADESRKRGIPFVGHIPTAVKVEEASEAGQKSIEHLTGMALGCSSEGDALFAEMQHTPRGIQALVTARAFMTYDEAKAQALFARLKKNGTWQCPTLTVVRSGALVNDPEFVKDERAKYVSAANRATWNPANDPRRKDYRSEDWAARKTRWEENFKMVGRMHRAGVSIIAGTDVMNPYCFPGFSLHDELALLVEAGLSPMEALQASTISAARFMGQLDRRGTIETGKIADLLLLEKSPLADIHNTRTINAVVLRGKLIPRAVLDQMLKDAEAAAK